MPDPNTPDYLEAGSTRYRMANFAMFIGGFATFALLYSTQPLLPLLTTTFNISPAYASLSVSAGTAALALMLIPASILSDRMGRVPVMKWALALSAVISLLCATVADYHQLLILRALLGATLAGLPAAAMAYLGEEVAPAAQGKAIGLYIAGNALGGMSGRIAAALLTDLGGWRISLLILGLLGLAAAIAFWRTLPSSRHFRARAAALSRIAGDARTILADTSLPWLFLTSLLAMGAFISVYNYLGFRLVDQPFQLSQSAVGAVFLLYLIGSWASALAGQLADRHGRHRVQWIMVLIMTAGLALTLSDTLLVLLCGVGIFTFGFFATHSISSSWVAHRGKAQRGLATAIYLSCYYLGASFIGSLTGYAWDWGKWYGLSTAIAACLALLMGVVLRLRWLARQQIL